jgi:hypothetical protein
MASYLARTSSEFFDVAVPSIPDEKTSCVMRGVVPRYRSARRGAGRRSLMQEKRSLLLTTKRGYCLGDVAGEVMTTRRHTRHMKSPILGQVRAYF